MHRTKRDKLIVHIKMLCAIVILVGLTIFVLEVPKFIYKRNDGRLVKNVVSSKYDVGNLTVDMGGEQMAAAMFSEDTMFIETNKTYDKNEVNTYKQKMYGVLFGHVSEGWCKRFESVLLDPDSKTVFSTLRVVRIVNDVVYSGEVGILSFYKKQGVELSVELIGTLVYDINNEKFLGITCFAYGDNQYSEEEFVDIYENAVYERNDKYDEYYAVHSIDDLYKIFLIPAGYEECVDVFAYADAPYFDVHPFIITNPRKYYDYGYAPYWEWDYNMVYEKISRIAEEQESGFPVTGYYGY